MFIGAFDKRASSQRGMALDVLALALAIAGSLFFTSQLWSVYRETISITNLSVSLSALTPLRPQIFTYDAYGFIIAESAILRTKRADSLVALLAGVTPELVISDVPAEAVFVCVAHAAPTHPDPNVPIVLDFPIRSSNASDQNCTQLDLSVLAKAEPNSLYIVVGSTRDPRPAIVLPNYRIGRALDRIYAQYSTVSAATFAVTDYGLVGVDGGANPM